MLNVSTIPSEPSAPPSTQDMLDNRVHRIQRVAAAFMSSDRAEELARNVVAAWPDPLDPPLPVDVLECAADCIRQRQRHFGLYLEPLAASDTGNATLDCATAIMRAW